MFFIRNKLGRHFQRLWTPCIASGKNQRPLLVRTVTLSRDAYSAARDTPRRQLRRRRRWRVLHERVSVKRRRVSGRRLPKSFPWPRTRYMVNHNSRKKKKNKNNWWRTIEKDFVKKKNKKKKTLVVVHQSSHSWLSHAQRRRRWQISPFLESDTTDYRRIMYET